MTQFNMIDTNKPDGFYVTFERLTVEDYDTNPNDYLFQDEDYRDHDQERLDAWENNDWCYIGIQAKANCLVVHNNVGTYYTLTSAGLYGIESDSGADYLNEIYQEQIEDLKADILAMKSPVFC